MSRTATTTPQEGTMFVSGYQHHRTSFANLDLIEANPYGVHDAINEGHRLPLSSSTTARAAMILRLLVNQCSLCSRLTAIHWPVPEPWQYSHLRCSTGKPWSSSRVMVPVPRHGSQVGGGVQ